MVKKILDGNWTSPRKDIQRFGRILELIFFYEEEDYDALSNRCSLTLRMLRKQSEIHPLEAIVLKYMKIFADLPPIAQYTKGIFKIFQKLQKAVLIKIKTQLTTQS